MSIWESFPFLLRAISEHSPKIRPADYTPIWRRTFQMKVELETIEDVSELTVILDSTSFKMTDAGNWINYIYDKTLERCSTLS